MLILSHWTIFWLSSKRNPLADSIGRAISSFRSVVSSDRRWSRGIAQNNLIDSCLRDKTKFDRVPKFIDLNKFLDKYWYMTWEKVDDMKESIFWWLLEMINEGGNLKQLLKHRGNYVITKKVFINELGWSIVDVEFVRSLLLWHIATDMYGSSFDHKDPDPKSRYNISKLLSNYMFHLLVI